MPPFKSALLKIERAQRQASDLYNGIMGFYGRPGDDPTYRIDFERDADPRKWRGIFRLLKQPSDDWPLLLGEIVHNLRSALDHLVFEASAPDEHGQPLRRTGFPVFIDSDEWRRRKARDRIRGLNDATRAFVESCQLFTNRDSEIGRFLWLLHQLSNTDKHRLLNIIVVPHELTDFRIRYQPGGTPLTRDHVVNRIDVIKDTRLEDGAEFCAFWTPKPLPKDIQVHVNAEIEIGVEFGDATPEATGQPVFHVLARIGSLVGAIRNEFIESNPRPT